MGTWKVSVGSRGYFKEKFVAEALETELIEKANNNNELELDDSQVIPFLNATGSRVAGVFIIEKRIVLPAPTPQSTCPTCNGTGNVPG